MIVYQTSSINFTLPLSVLSFLFLVALVLNVMSPFHTQIPQPTSISLSTATAQPDQNVVDSRTRILRIALLTDALFSDAGWGAFGYNAAQALHTKYGYEVDFKDNVSIANIEPTLRQYADLGYDLLIAQGYEWGEPAVKVGLDYPNTKFVVFTGLSNSSNVASIYPMQQEATYLLGLAAMMSKTGT